MKVTFKYYYKVTTTKQGIQTMKTKTQSNKGKDYTREIILVGVAALVIWQGFLVTRPTPMQQRLNTLDQHIELNLAD